MSKIAPLRAAQAASASLKLVSTPNVMNVEQAAYAVWRFAMMLRDVPNYPNCQHIKEARQKAYDEAIETLREAING